MKFTESEINTTKRVMSELLLDIGYDLRIFEREIIMMDEWLEDHTVEEEALRMEEVWTGRTHYTDVGQYRREYEGNWGDFDGKKEGK